MVQNGDAVGEKFDFRQGVRSKEKCRALMAQDLGFQKVSKIGGGEGIEAARGFVEQHNLRLMEKGAKKTKALDGTTRKGPHLAVERIGDLELLGGSGNMGPQVGVGKMIETAEKVEVVAHGQTRIETEVGTGVVADVFSNSRGLARRIEAGDASTTARRKQQGGENAQESRLSGAIGAEQRHRFPAFHIKRQTAKRGHC